MTQSGGFMGDVLAWLLTYGVHSTVLLGLVALVTWRHVRAEAWRDALWKAALVGAIVTASVQQLARTEPLGGVVRIAARAGEASGAQPLPLPVLDAAAAEGSTLLSRDPRAIRALV